MKKPKGSKVILPFRWAGGKYYALKLLSKFWLKQDHDEYREPFLGGGSVFWAKEKVKYNWINDIDKNLIDTLKFISDKDKLPELLELFESEYEATKEKYNQVKSLIPKTDLESAYRFYYLNRTSFSGKMNNPSWGYRPKRSLPPRRFKERLIPCSEKLQDVKITSLDFEDVICAPPRGKNVLLFLDPPYFLPNMNSHYVNGFKMEDHLRLSKVLKETKYNFFLTYDDCKEVRELYSWANIYEINFIYRLNNSNDNYSKRMSGNELVITNYKI